MPRKLRQLRADLKAAGCIIIRQRGSHQTWKHPLVSAHIVILSGQDGKDAKAYQERDVQQLLAEIQRKARP